MYIDIAEDLVLCKSHMGIDIRVLVRTKRRVTVRNVYIYRRVTVREVSCTRHNVYIYRPVTVLNVYIEARCCAHDVYT